MLTLPSTWQGEGRQVCSTSGRVFPHEPQIHGLPGPGGLGEEWLKGVHSARVHHLCESNWRIPRRGPGNVPEEPPLEQPSSRYSW